MNFSRQFYYLETNAIIALTTSEIRKLSNRDIYTSSFALIEFLKGTNNKNYLQKKNKVEAIYNNLKIDWYTTTEKITTMYNYIKIQDNLEYKDHLEPLIIKIMECSNYEELINKIDKDINTTFEEIDEIYKRIKYIMDKILSGEEIYKIIENVILCPECFFAVGVQNKLKQKHLRESKEEYKKIILSYNHNADIFFNCCKYYYYNYYNNKPNKNDFVDLMHTLYIPNLATAIITNDKKLSKICKNGAKVKAITLNSFKQLVIN